MGKAQTSVPSELVSIFRYWYSQCCEVGGLCVGGVQGGLASPTLFNLYMDGLIGELSSAMVGCSVDGKFVNNISYADDMVLLSPSISALRKLLKIYEWKLTAYV